MELYNNNGEKQVKTQEKKVVRFIGQILYSMKVAKLGVVKKPFGIYASGCVYESLYYFE